MYYIDFDNTLYETGKLTKDVIFNLAKIISTKNDENIDTIHDNIHASFNSSTDNFFTLAKKLSLQYHVSYEELYSKITELIISLGKNYVFPDALEFLKKLQNSGENTAILTYVTNSKNLNQQSLKLTGSGILDYVSEVYSTTRQKYKLEIDYKNNNNVFIDDNPSDLEGLYNAGARNIIRIVKPNNEKRTSKKLSIPTEIPTFSSFNQIQIKSKVENYLALE